MIKATGSPSIRQAGRALLAVGVNLGTPWLINPLLGALLIFLMLEYVEQRMGKELVRVASLLLP